MPKGPGLAAMRGRYWLVIVALVAVIAVIVVIVLKRGNSLVTTATATPPLEFSVAPATLGGTSPAGPRSSACTLAVLAGASQGSTSVNESLVAGSLVLSEGTTVKSVVIRVLSRQAVSESAYQACAGAMPGYARAPGGWHVVRLPAAGNTVSLPALESGGGFNLVVRPPVGRASGAVAYVWEIDISFTSGYGPGTDSSEHFTLLAPPA